MTGVLESLEAVPDGTRYPARHEVRDAVLVRDRERIPVVVKRVARDRRQGPGRTRAERSLAVARALLAAGVATPEPLGIEVGPDASWYVARHLAGAFQIRHWMLHHDDPGRWPAPPAPASFEQVVTALGRLARRMHDGRVFFRDFTDGNVLVTVGPEGLRLWLVDLDRARLFRGPLPLWPRLRDLARPGLNDPGGRQLLLEAYFEPERCPGWIRTAVGLLRGRIVLWDDTKARLRPWRRRTVVDAVSSRRTT